MPEITSIEPQKRNRDRCNIYVDGRFYCGLTLEAAVKFRLKVGMSVEKEFLDNVQLETDKNTALDKALNYISATRKTEKQVTDFLVKKGYTPLVCDFVIEKLRYYNFVDDSALCKAYVAERKGAGKKLIEIDLKRRGIDKKVIEEALSDYEESPDEARAVAEKYLRGKERSKENIFKAYRYLLQRGYSYDTAQSALEGLGEEQ